MGTITKQPIGTEDIQLKSSGTSRTTFTRTNASGQVLTLNKLDIADLQFRSLANSPEDIIDGGYDITTKVADNINKALVDARAYNSGALTDTTITTAIAANANKQIILTPGTWIISNALTIPTGSVLKVNRGALLTKASGGSITFSTGSFLDVGRYQIFSGFSEGDITWDSSGIQHIYPEWWTANTIPGTTDMTTAIKSSLSATTNGTVELAAGGFYAYSDHLFLPHRVSLIASQLATLTTTSGKSLLIGSVGGTQVDIAGELKNIKLLNTSGSYDGYGFIFGSGHNDTVNLTCTTDSSATLTTAGNFNDVDNIVKIGANISGIGIADNTFVVSVDSDTSLTMSQAATANGSVSIAFRPYVITQYKLDNFEALGFDIGMLSTGKIYNNEIRHPMLRNNNIGLKFDWAHVQGAGEIVNISGGAIASNRHKGYWQYGGSFDATQITFVGTMIQNNGTVADAANTGILIQRVGVNSIRQINFYGGLIAQEGIDYPCLIIDGGTVRMDGTMVIGENPTTCNPIRLILDNGLQNSQLTIRGAYTRQGDAEYMIESTVTTGGIDTIVVAENIRNSTSAGFTAFFDELADYYSISNTTGWDDTDNAVNVIKNELSIEGKLTSPTTNGSVGTVTLTANATSTTVSNTRLTANSLIFLQPRTANAAADVGSATSVYIGTVTAATSFIITHPNNANVDKSFNYWIVN